jgi:hypothetical protein
MRSRINFILKATSIVLFSGLLFITLSCSPRPTILMIIRDSSTMEYMIPNEILLMKNIANKAGYRIHIASETGAKIEAGKENLSPDFKFSEVDINKYIGLIIPCCASGPMPKPNTEAAKKLVGAAIELKLPIAAQYSGIDLLVLSGLSKDTKLARSFLFASTDTGPGVVVDKNIVTSGTCPWMARYQKSTAGTENLMKEFINQLPRSK